MKLIDGSQAIEDKAQRSAIHQTVRERFGGFFDTGTKDKAIVVSVKGSIHVAVLYGKGYILTLLRNGRFEVSHKDR